MERDAGLEMEKVGEGIGSVPEFGEVAVQIHLRIAPEQSAENEAIESLRLAVGGEARIEIDGIGFDEKGDGGRIEICRMRAAGDKAK